MPSAGGGMHGEKASPSACSDASQLDASSAAAAAGPIGWLLALRTGKDGAPGPVALVCALVWAAACAMASLGLIGSLNNAAIEAAEARRRRGKPWRKRQHTSGAPLHRPGFPWSSSTRPRPTGRRSRHSGGTPSAAAGSGGRSCCCNGMRPLPPPSPPPAAKRKAPPPPRPRPRPKQGTEGATQWGRRARPRPGFATEASP